MEYQIGKCDCDKDTQFINRHYHARKSVLQRFVIAEPGTAGCKSRQTDKSQFPPVNPANLLLLALDCVKLMTDFFIYFFHP